jgi:hypothetical protein
LRVKIAIEESMKRVIKRRYRMISNLIYWEIMKAIALNKNDGSVRENHNVIKAAR